MFSCLIFSAGILVRGWEKSYFFWSARKKPAWTQLESLLSSSSFSQFRSSRKSCLHFNLKIPFPDNQSTTPLLIPCVIDVRNCYFNLMFSMKVPHNVGSVCSRQRTCHGIGLYHDVCKFDQVRLRELEVPVF